MAWHSVFMVTAPFAVLLVIATGFCVMVGATKLAGRLLLIAMGILILPPLALEALGSIHLSVDRAPGANVAAGAMLMVAFVACGIALWALIRLKIIHAIQDWILPRFGTDVDGQVTGLYLASFLNSLFAVFKLLVLISVVVSVLVFWR